MDLLTHAVLTRKFIDKKPGIVLCGSLAPDLPFYLFYPAWVTGRDKLVDGLESNDWPEPPRWMSMLHHVFHSIPAVTLGAIIVRLVAGRWPGKAYAAWLLHIAVDIPTHSRKQWGPKFLWPFSDFAVDGVSWVEVGGKVIAGFRQRFNNNG